MDWREAVEIVIGRQPGPYKHTRWRDLCADDHPDRNLHRARVVAMATGGGRAATPPAPAARTASPAAAMARNLVRAQKCPYRSRDTGCGCSGVRCALRRGVVPVAECHACIETYGDP